MSNENENENNNKLRKFVNNCTKLNARNLNPIVRAVNELQMVVNADGSIGGNSEIAARLRDGRELGEILPNQVPTTGFEYYSSSSPDGRPAAAGDNWVHYLTMSHTSSHPWAAQLALPMQMDGRICFRRTGAAMPYGNWRQLAWLEDVNATLPLSGGRTMTGNIQFSDTGATVGNWRGIFGTIAANDNWTIRGYTDTNGSNEGALEIATGDDGNEPIFVRQYGSSAPTQGSIPGGVALNVQDANPATATNRRTATLLGRNGQTVFPVSVDAPVIRENGQRVLTQVTADARYLQQTGGTITGDLTGTGNITANGRISDTRGALGTISVGGNINENRRSNVDFRLEGGTLHITTS